MKIIGGLGFYWFCQLFRQQKDKNDFIFVDLPPLGLHCSLECILTGSNLSYKQIMLFVNAFSHYSSLSFYLQCHKELVVQLEVWEVKIPFDPVCPSVGLLVVRSVCLPFLKG